MKILAICPSIRPTQRAFMLDSFLSTRSDCTTIIIHYNKGNLTKIYNEIFFDNPNYDFYHMMNDDTLYRTDNWDLNLAKKGKITYGNDCLQEENLCTFPMIDGRIVRALGWLQLPTLEKYCGDSVWKFIGQSLNILEYVPEVVIEHKWEGQNDELCKEDMAKFAQWLPEAYKDLDKIRKVIC